jgi:hypothetical protein
MYNSSKQVLSKIAKMLNLSEEVNFTDAKTEDGTILQSPTFDLNEDVEVVSADGTKSPAPDGEYTISLKDESGNENIIRIEVKDGKITERANEEEEKNEGENEEEMDDQTPTDANSSVDGTVNMAKDFVKAPKGLETDEAHALPMGTDEDPRNRVGSDEDDKKDPIISLSYRISELESQLKECMAKIGELTDRKDVDQKGEQTTETEDNVSLEEVDVPKLDGAPIEMSAQVNLAGVHKPNNKREGNYQSSFLSKLYK